MPEGPPRPARDVTPVRLTVPPWDRVLDTALETAERLVADWYGIRPREWSSRFRYDLASSTDHPELAFPGDALAQLVRLEDPEGNAPGRWRIVLRDDALHRLGERHGLAALLAWTLLHELVHLVRFATGLAAFDGADADARAAEERHVDTVVHRIVAAADDPGLAAVDRVLARPDGGLRDARPAGSPAPPRKGEPGRTR